MSQVTTPTQPGWLPDPSGRYEWRYWDGGWTNRVANSAPTEPAPAREPAPPPTWAAVLEPVVTPAPAPIAGPVSPPAQEDLEAPEVAAFVADPADAPPKPMTARDAVPRVPFGTEPVPGTATPAPAPPRARRTPWAAFVGFFRSFADQPESYHHPLSREPLPPDPRGERLVQTAPGNYGHAMIVALAAVGIVVGAYLPWISGTIGLAHFARSGFDVGHGGGYTIGAMALAISAMLSVQMRPFRWLTIVLAFVITGFVVKDVLDSYDAMQQMNQLRAYDANVGWGLWIMIVASAIAMIGAVRLSEDEKIG
jgi:hypothetical protein